MSTCGPRADGKKETVIVGDKVTDGDKTMVPLFSAYGREALVGAGGKPLLVELSSLQEVSAGRRLRLALRPLIDAFSGQSDLRNPDPAARRAAATKMGNAGDAAALPTLVEALAKESDRWARHAMEEAIALINLRSGTNDEKVLAARRLGELRSVNALERLQALAGDDPNPTPLQQAARVSAKTIERWGLSPRRSRRSSRASRSRPSCS